MKKLILSPFEIGTLAWISTAIFLLILALLGAFHAWLGLIFLLGIISWMIFLVKKDKIGIRWHNQTEMVILICLFIFGLFLSIYTTPTIFGGRDEGSFSNAAIMLVKDHGLKSSSDISNEFFKIYGPGKALNFPGFIYTQKGQLKSQFLPGYTSWVAFWYGTFGVKGISFANLLPLVTFLFSFFLISKKFVNKKNFELAGWLILAASLPIVVFYKFTLTEIFFGALSWFCLHLTLEYLQNKSLASYKLLFIPLLLLPFVRIESVAIIFTVFFILVSFDFKNLKKAPYQLLFVITGISFAIAVFSNAHFFVDSFKNFFELSKFGEAHDGSGGIPFLPDDWGTLFLPKVLFTYNLLPIFVLGIVAIAYLLKKKKWKLLVPAFFFAPTLVYIVDANISLDHPWMLRRFTFSIIPLFVLYSVFLLSAVAHKLEKFAMLFCALLVLIFGLQSLGFIFFRQNGPLLGQAREITEKIGQGSLLLVARQASGNGWSLLSEPLRNADGLNAVYFFNPNDLSEIDRAKFSNIYLLASESDQELFSELQKSKISKYQIKNSIISVKENPLEKPAIESYEISGSLYKLD